MTKYVGMVGCACACVCAVLVGEVAIRSVAVMEAKGNAGCIQLVCHVKLSVDA
jgi:hypothetical protein